MYRSDKGILGLLRQVKRVPVPSIEQAGEELAQQMQCQFTLEPPLNARVRSPNRFLFNMRMESVLYGVLLPAVRVHAYGDEQIYITAASLLERYVRTPEWYLDEDDDDLYDDDDDEDDDDYDDDDNDEAEACLLLVSEGLRSSSPPLDSSLATITPRPDGRRRAAADRSGTELPLILIEVALVCVRLSMIRVFSDEQVDTRNFYTKLVNSLRGGEMVGDEDTQVWFNNVDIGCLKAREMRVLKALKYRLDVPTLFDMWTVCDQVVWGDDGVAATLNDDERHTLSAFAATLLVYTQSDRRLATSSLWLSAGAICLLVTHAAVNDAYATKALERVARALAHAVAVSEQQHVDDDTERALAERLARLIVVRANNIRTGLADAARDEQSFDDRFVRNLLREQSESFIDKIVRRFAGTYRRINRPEEIRLPPWLTDRIGDAKKFDSLMPDEKTTWRCVVEEAYPERRDIDVLALVDYVRQSRDFDINLLELERAKRDRQAIEHDLIDRDASVRRRLLKS
jgi:hypothetical protein